MRYNIKVRKNVYVPLAQPDRVFGYEPKGRGFESLKARQTRVDGIQWIPSTLVLCSLYAQPPGKFFGICHNVRFVFKILHYILRTFGF